MFLNSKEISKKRKLLEKVKGGKLNTLQHLFLGYVFSYGIDTMAKLLNIQLFILDHEVSFIPLILGFWLLVSVVTNTIAKK